MNFHYLYVFVDAVVWCVTLFTMLMFTVQQLWLHFLWAFLFFWLYPIGIELWVNIWGFWAAAQRHTCHKELKPWTFPIVFSPEYVQSSYCNWEYRLHGIDWRVPRSVFTKLRRLDLVHTMTEDDRMGIETLEKAGISYEHYLASVERYHDEEIKLEVEHKRRLAACKNDEEKRAYLQ
jgi:hypothetical protein